VEKNISLFTIMSRLKVSISLAYHYRNMVLRERLKKS